MAQRSLRRNLAFYLAILIAAFALPASGLHAFDGLPWSSPWEYGWLLCMLPVFFLRPAKITLRLLLKRLGPAARISLTLLALMPLLTKISSRWLWPEYGFAACYQSLVPNEGGRCERSFEEPSAPPTVTRFDRALDFGPTEWRLGFVNSLRFNIRPVDGAFARNRLPFGVTWRALVSFTADTTLVVRYVGEGSVTVGSRTLVLPRHYPEPAVATYLVPAGTYPFTAAYRFDDGFRIGQTTTGSDPQFSIRVRGPGDTQELLTAAMDPAQQVVAWTADAMLMLHQLVPIVIMVTVLRHHVLWLANLGAAACLIVARGRVESVGSSRALTALFFLFVVCLFAVKSTSRTLLAFYGLAFLVTARVYVAFADWRAVALRSWGEDWLTYESFARTILEQWSLMGAEPVFYYQPLYRYIRFVERLLFGEGDAPVAAVGLLAACFGIMLVALRAYRTASGANRAIVILSGVVCLALMWSAPLLGFLIAGASEYPTWVMLPYAFLCVIGAHPATWSPIAAAVILGISAVTRTNQLPAAVVFACVIVGIAALRGKRRAVTLGLPLLLAILLLPLTHNLYYGGRFVLTTSAADIPENLVLPPRQLPEVFSNAAVRSRLVDQVSALLYLVPGEGTIPAIFRCLQLLWLVATLLAVRDRRSAAECTILALPWLYLAPHVFYQTAVYYPRHIIIGHLAFGLSAAWIASRRSPVVRRIDRPMTQASVT